MLQTVGVYGDNMLSLSNFINKDLKKLSDKGIKDEDIEIKYSRYEGNTALIIYKTNDQKE